MNGLLNFYNTRDNPTKALNKQHQPNSLRVFVVTVFVLVLCKAPTSQAAAVAAAWSFALVSWPHIQSHTHSHSVWVSLLRSVSGWTASTLVRSIVRRRRCCARRWLCVMLISLQTKSVPPEKVEHPKWRNPIKFECLKKYKQQAKEKEDLKVVLFPSSVD